MSSRLALTSALLHPGGEGLILHAHQLGELRAGSAIPTITYTRGLDLSGSLQGGGGIGGLLGLSDQ